MKIYVLTQGEYDDYHICYVTEDKNKAEAFSARHNELYPLADPVCIETHDTDDMPTVSPDSFFYSVYRDWNWDWDNNKRIELDTYTVTEEYEICPDSCVVASTPEEAIDIYKDREIARKKLKEENDESSESNA